MADALIKQQSIKRFLISQQILSLSFYEKTLKRNLEVDTMDSDILFRDNYYIGYYFPVDTFLHYTNGYNSQCERKV